MLQRSQPLRSHLACCQRGPNRGPSLITTFFQKCKKHFLYLAHCVVTRAGHRGAGGGPGDQEWQEEEEDHHRENDVKQSSPTYCYTALHIDLLIFSTKTVIRSLM